MVKNRKCIACGTKYSYCPDCSRADALKPTWYSNFCSESCKDLWLTISRYSMDRLTKTEAKSVILELDLKPIESYSQFIQKDYAKIMIEEKKSRKAQKKIEPVIDADPMTFEQPAVAELVVEEPTAHEVVKQENE